MFIKNLLMQHKFKYRAHQDIDFERWDRCVSSVECPQPYGFSWYLNWLSDSWDALVYGDYDVVMPVFPRVKNSFKYSTRPFGTQSTGPYSRIPLTSEWSRSLIESAMDHMVYGEFFLSPGTSLYENWKPKEFTNLVIDASPPYEELILKYSTQNKRSIKKANQLKLEWASWTTVKEAVTLWQTTTQEKTSISSVELDRLTKLLEFCSYQKRARLYAVRDEYNQLAGAQCWIDWKGRTTLLLNATNEWGKDNGVSAWLIDQHIQTVAGSKQVIDFEGSSLPGLSRFYTGFGAKNEPFYMHIENRLPFWARLFKPNSTY